MFKFFGRILDTVFPSRGRKRVEKYKAEKYADYLKYRKPADNELVRAYRKQFP